MPTWLLAVLVLPWAAAAVVVGLRSPAILIAAYASILPFGSSIALPLGLPGPFNTATTVLGLLASAGLALHLLLTPARARSIPGPLPWWLLFSAVAAASVQWSVDPTLTMDSLLVLLSLVALYGVATLVRLGRRDLRLIEAGLALSGALTGAYALLLLVTGQMHIGGDGIPRFQTAGGGGEGGDPNITAASLILPLAVALAAGFSDRSTPRRAAYLTAAALTGAATLLTGSRGGLLAVLLTIIVLIRYDRRPGARLAYTLIPLAVIAMTFNAASEAMQTRVQNPDSSGRIDIWRIATEMCVDDCDTGVGWGAFAVAFTDAFLSDAATDGTRLSVQPHSIWLRIPLEIGWAGLVVFLGGLLSTWRSMRGLPALWRGPPIAAFLGLLLTNSLLGNFDFKYFWMTLMYVAFVVTAYESEQDDQLEELPADGSDASAASGAAPTTG